MIAVLTALLVFAPPQEIDRRTAKEIEARIERYINLDGKTSDGHAARTALLAEIDEAAPGVLSSKAVTRWRETIFEAWEEEGATLPKKSGREHFWKDDKRGLYILGGTTKRPRGLLIGMHGGGVGAGDCAEAAAFLGSAAKKQKWVAIFPEVLEKTEHGWTTAGTEEWVIELVDRARRTFGVDADRVFFAGHSMGGFGSWTLGAHHADLVAALGPAAGAPTPYVNERGEIWSIADGVVPNLRNVPMRVFQSADDPKVPPAANRVAVKRVEEAKDKWGGYEDFEYIEVDGHGHAYPPGGGKDWLAALSDYERNARPTKVVWQPALTWKRQFYWLYWDSPVIGTTIVAEIGQGNVIQIDADKPVPGLQVLLSPELLDLDDEIIVRLGSKEVWRGHAEPRLSTLLLTGATGDDGRLYLAQAPVSGR